MISVENICKSFNGRPILNRASFSLDDGDMAGLVGPSGGGKTVLLKLVGGVLSADSGEVLFCGASGTRRSVSVGFSFQEGALFDSLSVLENVAFPLTARSHSEREQTCMGYLEAMERAYESLASVGLSKDVYKMPGQISGGMRRRVGIARALVARPELVLLDDPTGGLDPVAASVIIDLIKELHASYNPTVVIVSHDIRRLLPNVSRVLALFGGTVVCNECPFDLLANADAEVVKFLETRFDFSVFGGVG